MPNVPGIPSPQGLPQYSANAPAEAFGGGSIISDAQRAAGKLGTAVDKYAAEEGRKANESALTGLDLEASHEQTRIEIQAKKM